MSVETTTGNAPDGGGGGRTHGMQRGAGRGRRPLSCCRRRSLLPAAPVRRAPPTRVLFETRVTLPLPRTGMYHTTTRDTRIIVAGEGRTAGTQTFYDSVPLPATRNSPCPSVPEPVPSSGCRCRRDDPTCLQSP